MNRITPTLAVWLLISVFMLATFDEWKDWRGGNTPFIQDVDQYYCYLPAAFVHHDLRFRYPHKYWMLIMPDGQFVPQRTMGMALLYMPFFLIAHGIAKVMDYPADGYSPVYVWVVYFGTMVYSIIGLYFLRRSLLYFYSEKVAAITLAVVFLGTNLFYYTLGWGEMPHSYLFMLFSLLIFFTIKWHTDHRWQYMAAIAFVGGFVTLIRPTEGLVLLVPLGYGVYDMSTLRAKVKLLARYKWQLLLAASVFMIPIIPQLVYWKVLTGSWFFNSYGATEPFFFNDPKILELLFSYRKGWLVYTPVMIFAIAGMFFLKRFARAFLFCVPLFLIISIYILSSWWCWWYGGTFGTRVLVQSYAVLAFPMAAFFTWLLEKGLNYLILLLFMIPFIKLNTFQTRQYENVMLHWDAMNKESYWIIFGKTELSEEEKKRYDAALIHPDYEEARKGTGR